MFEEVTEDKVTSGSKTGLIVAIAAAIVVGAGIYYYTISNRSAQGPEKAAAPAGATANTPPDPVKDLKILSATMAKDKMGTATVWNVTIENRSRAYTYSAIEYETLYFGANNQLLLTNQGRIAASIDPGDQNKSEIRESLYPPGMVLYQFKITGAKSSTQ